MNIFLQLIRIDFHFIFSFFQQLSNLLMLLFICRYLYRLLKLKLKLMFYLDHKFQCSEYNSPIGAHASARMCYTFRFVVTYNCFFLPFLNYFYFNFFFVHSSSLTILNVFFFVVYLKDHSISILSHILYKVFAYIFLYT